VASMRLVETNACAFNAPEFGNTRARLLEAYRYGIGTFPNHDTPFTSLL
jgi:hypothetical protein